MKVLIVESNSTLGKLWSAHLTRLGVVVTLVTSQEVAINALSEDNYNMIILNVVLRKGSALAVADYISYRWPETRIIFVTNSSFFSDGSIFNHSSNACAFIPQTTAPEDLAAMVDYYAS